MAIDRERLAEKLSEYGYAVAGWIYEDDMDPEAFNGMTDAEVVEEWQHKVREARRDMAKMSRYLSRLKYRHTAARSR